MGRPKALSDAERAKLYAHLIGNRYGTDRLGRIAAACGCSRQAVWLILTGKRGSETPLARKIVATCRRIVRKIEAGREYQP